MAKIEINKVTTKKRFKGNLIKFSDDLYKDEPKLCLLFTISMKWNFFLPEKNPAYEY